MRCGRASRIAWLERMAGAAMTDFTSNIATSNIASVVERTRPVKADALVVGVHFLGRTAAFVLGEETVLLASPDGEARRCPVHGGAVLAAAADGKRIVTGGDDGKVVITTG